MWANTYSRRWKKGNSFARAPTGLLSLCQTPRWTLGPESRCWFPHSTESVSNKQNSYHFNVQIFNLNFFFLFLLVHYDGENMTHTCIKTTQSRELCVTLKRPNDALRWRLLKSLECVTLWSVRKLTLHTLAFICQTKCFPSTQYICIFHYISVT